MQQTIAHPAPEAPRETLEYGPLTVDLDGFAVFVGRRDVPLTFSEFLLLKTLALKPYRVHDRDAVLAALQTAGRGHVAEAPDLRLVDRHVARLRKKLRQAGCDCIETMRFAGYRFVPPSESSLPGGLTVEYAR